MSPRRAKAVQGRVDDDPATALREHLIDAAERLLAERQVTAITTRDIARGAGVSDGVLYNYFAGKQELLLAAALRRYTRIAERFDTDLPHPGTGDVESNLVAYCDAARTFHADLLPIAASLLSEPDLLRRLMQEVHRQPFRPQHTQDRVRHYLAGEVALGRVPADMDPNAAAVLLLGGTFLLAVRDHTVGTEFTEGMRPRTHALVRTLLRGSAPGSASQSAPPNARDDH
jgi:AcrR family transcriptional regulator